MTSAWKTKYESAQVIMALLHKSIEFEEVVVDVINDAQQGRVQCVHVIDNYSDGLAPRCKCLDCGVDSLFRFRYAHIGFRSKFLIGSRV